MYFKSVFLATQKYFFSLFSGLGAKASVRGKLRFCRVIVSGYSFLLSSFKFFN